MADKKITQLTELAVRPDYNIDVIPIVDSGSAASATKKISRNNYIPELNVTTGSATASKALVLDENSDIKDLRTVSASVTSTASFGRFMAAGNSNFSGNITIGGNLNIGDANTDYVVVQADLSSSLRPNNDNAFNIGSTALTWKNIYFKSNISGSSATTASFGALTTPGGVLSTLIPAVSDGAALGTTSKMWSDLFLASGGVVNFNNGDVTLTHASNEIQVDGGDLVVEGTNKVGLGGAPSTDYIQKSTNIRIVAAADIVLDPAGGEVDVDGNLIPNSDSADDLGASGQAWNKLWVDDIDLNGQGSISIGGTGRIDLDADDDTSVRASADDVITFEAGAVDIAQITSTMAISGSSVSTGSFGKLEVAGNSTLTGNLTLGGNITIGDSATDSISVSADFTSHLIPDSDNTYDLGSAAQSWRHVYAEGNVSSSATSTGSFGNLYIDDDALVKDRVYFNDFGGEYISGDGTDLNLTSGNDINVPANIGLTFGDDGEKIEGNGTRLSIASGDGLVLDSEGDIEINADGGDVVVKDNTAILLNVSATDISGSSTSTGSFGKLEGDGASITNLTAAAITNVANDGADRVFTMDGDGTGTAEANLTFDGTTLSGSSAATSSFGAGIVIDKLYFNDFGGEYISGDGTDLTLTSGADINIPSNIGLTFGNDGEKIEGNGTRLSIASGTGMVLDCEGDIEINADGGDVAIKDNTVALLDISATKVSGSATSTGSFGSIVFDDFISGDGSSLTGIPTAASVSGSFAQKTAVSSSFAQKSAVSGSLGLVTGLNTGTTVISGSATSTGSFAALSVAGRVTTNLVPTADNSTDLGAASYRWANVYTADLHLNNEGNPNSVDGTTGNWTVQEGEDYIYVVNNKSNKKFKLMLEEIE